MSYFVITDEFIDVCKCFFIEFTSVTINAISKYISFDTTTHFSTVCY